MHQPLDMKDADGRPIRLGSVLQHVTEDRRGVVTEMVTDPDRVYRYAVIPPALGDIHIQLSPSSYRVTNKWTEWRHIPREQRTVEERWRSWVAAPFFHDDWDGRQTFEEGLAISGIQALLPPDAVPEDFCSPDVEDTLILLRDYLIELENKLPKEHHAKNAHHK